MHTNEVGKRLVYWKDGRQTSGGIGMRDLGVLDEFGNVKNGQSMLVPYSLRVVTSDFILKCNGLMQAKQHDLIYALIGSL